MRDNDNTTGCDRFDEPCEVNHQSQRKQRDEPSRRAACSPTDPGCNDGGCKARQTAIIIDIAPKATLKRRWGYCALEFVLRCRVTLTYPPVMSTGGLGRKARSANRLLNLDQAGVASLSPTMPPTISATLMSRGTLRGLPNSTMPRPTVPTEPTPTQTLYAAPTGATSSRRLITKC